MRTGAHAPGPALPAPLRRGLGVLFAAEVAGIAWFSTVGGAAQARVGALLSLDDLALHVLAFGVTAMTGFLALAPAGLVAGLTIAMAVTVELVQSALPGRDAALADVVAGVAGVGAAAAAFLVWGRGRA